MIFCRYQLVAGSRFGLCWFEAVWDLRILLAAGGN